MDFQITAINPKGRLKYGTYTSSKNITRSVQSVVNGGNVSTGGGGTEGGNDDVQTTSCVVFLQKEQNTFQRNQTAINPVTDSVRIVGYVGTELKEVYVGDVSGLIDANDAMGSGTKAPSPYYDVTGTTDTGVVIPLAGSGVTFSVTGNGTSACTINVTVDSTFPAGINEVTLAIPVNVYLKKSDISGNASNANELYVAWKSCNNANRQAIGDANGDLFTDTLYYYFSFDTESQSYYLLDLTNDSAGVNCDINGNILTGATRPPCTAVVYYGKDPVSGATFAMSLPQEANATGIRINNISGEVEYDYGGNFNFEGTTLNATITAEYQGYRLQKIFSISKNYPGVDGTGATTRWIVPSVSSIKVDPNSNNAVTPSTVTAKVMKQVNDQQPEEDNSTPMYWDWDTSTPRTVYSGAIPVVAAHDYLAIGLKNSGGTFYELETIPLLEEGVNGLPGASGHSVYRLDLSNESEYVNCDYEGNVIAGQEQYLSCTAKLYYGMDDATAKYSFSGSPIGVTIGENSGVITFGSTYAQNFGSNTSFQLIVLAKVSNVVRGQAIMTIIKNIPGEPGMNATRYWLVPSADAIRVDGSGNTYPSTITCEAYSQEGGSTPHKLLSSETPFIYWDYNTASPNKRYSGQTISINENKNFITFVLKTSTTVYDSETIPILRDGPQGPAGEGTRGAAIRGPVEWLSSSARRWCCGGENPSGDTLEEDTKFLDVIFRMSGNTKVYYVCNSSYTQSAGASWSSVSSHWTQTGDQYEFVASRVLLADSAKIEFLTNNELYLTTQSGNTAVVTGGARSAVLGETGLESGTTMFWAGADASHLDEAKFRVNYNGDLYAKSGTFAGYVQMPYTMFRDLAPNWEVSASAVSARYLSETDWRGRLEAAPSDPMYGTTYANKNTQKYYFYSGSRWIEVTKTGNVDGFFADERAYLVQNTVGADKIILPEPSASLNGFTYHILTLPNPPTRTPGTGDGVELVVMDDSAKLRMFAFAEGTMFDEYTKFEFHGGHIELTCIPMLDRNDDVVYYWVCTMCTGGVDLFTIEGTEEFEGAFYPVCGYSPNDGYYAPRLIQTDGTFGSSRRRDVIYITV